MIRQIPVIIDRTCVIRTLHRAALFSIIHGPQSTLVPLKQTPRIATQPQHLARSNMHLSINPFKLTHEKRTQALHVTPNSCFPHPDPTQHHLPAHASMYPFPHVLTRHVPPLAQPLTNPRTLARCVHQRQHDRGEHSDRAVPPPRTAAATRHAFTC